MENKILCKRKEKKKVKEEILQLDKKLRLCLNIVIYHTLLHQINIVLKSKLKAVSKRDTKTWQSLTAHKIKQNARNQNEFQKTLYIIPHTIRYPMMNWLLYLMVWIIKFLYVTIEIALQLNLSTFIKIYLMTYHIYLTFNLGR